MPYRNVERLERAQAKIEAARGTAEATTSRILYGQLSRTIERPVTDEPENTGTWHGRDEGGFVQGVTRVRYSYSERMSFEDIAWWLQLILKGGVTGTSDGAVTNPAYTWAFTPSSTTDDLATTTIEGGDPNNVSKSSMVAVQQAVFRFDESQSPYWAMDLDLMARDNVASAFTAGVPDRKREQIRAAGTKLFLDEGATAIGTTQLLGQLRSASITVQNNLEEKVFSEDEEWISADFARGEQLVTAEFVLEQKDRVRLDDYLTGETQKLRIVRAGSIIHDAVRKSWQVDIPVGKYQSFSDQRAGQNKTQTLGVMGYRNAASPVPITATVVNALATVS
jgi:hypothetical protein